MYIVNYSVQYTLYILQSVYMKAYCTMCNVHSTSTCIQYTLYIILVYISTLCGYNVQCTHSVHYNAIK